MFYPAGWPQSRELEYYAGRFSTVELNNPFYRVPTTETFAAWARRAPAGFCFAVKMNRSITHFHRLANAAAPLAEFLRRAEKLGDKLGPILLQFPARWRVNRPRLRAFLPLLPRGLRFAFEFRDASWLQPGVYADLRERGAALCLAIRPDLPPPPEELTADFTYARFHGGREAEGNFGESELRTWARRLRRYAARATVFAYFNNDQRGFALANARRLRALLGAAAPKLEPGAARIATEAPIERTS